jgi:hypothetical protein
MLLQKWDRAFRDFDNQARLHGLEEFPSGPSTDLSGLALNIGYQ